MTPEEIKEECELQIDEYYLPGDLGEIKIASTGMVHKIIQIESCVGGNPYATTLTLSPIKKELPLTEDANYEIIEPKQLPENRKIPIPKQ